MLPSGSYKEADVAAYSEAAQAADMSALEVAWDIAGGVIEEEPGRR